MCELVRRFLGRGDERPDGDGRGEGRGDGPDRVRPLPRRGAGGRLPWQQAADLRSAGWASWGQLTRRGHIRIYPVTHGYAPSSQKPGAFAVTYPVLGAEQRLSPSGALHCNLTPHGPSAWIVGLIVTAHASAIFRTGTPMPTMGVPAWLKPNAGRSFSSAALAHPS